MGGAGRLTLYRLFRERAGEGKGIRTGIHRITARRVWLVANCGVFGQRRCGSGQIFYLRKLNHLLQVNCFSKVRLNPELTDFHPVFAFFFDSSAETTRKTTIPTATVARPKRNSLGFPWI